ncbi:DUF397 domain-containing protein [Streptosporangium pseudovulgare]|uniref:Transcriptional regulator n=1 Tax=Streptosporangium pseudovulgare TaxID=35765 RepID=A0ABQ2QGD5_9ACTN|nr:DUF397 domain-containing protein [Streptosporangium pseudovulgare]GGP79916.1 transcriptional regulator [Streptosporangium pseudovulgare]
MDGLTEELRAATWAKSSLSGSNGGNCVEVAKLSGGRRGVRDSKNLAGPALVLTPGAWADFLATLKNGELD